MRKIIVAGLIMSGLTLIAVAVSVKLFPMWLAIPGGILALIGLSFNWGLGLTSGIRDWIELLSRRKVGATPAYDADRALFQKFLSELSSQSIVPFLRQHDFGGAFRFDNLVPLFHFVETWNDPEHAFHESVLNRKLRDLLSITNRFLRCVGANTVPVNVGIQAVSREWRTDDPERYNTAVRELNKLADELAKQHEDFVTTARRTLHA